MGDWPKHAEIWEGRYMMADGTWSNWIQGSNGTLPWMNDQKLIESGRVQTRYLYSPEALAAARRQGFEAAREKAAKIAKDYALDALPESEYALACNDLDEAIHAMEDDG